MRFIFIGICFVSHLAFASGDIAQCTDEKGYTFYPAYGGIIPKNKNGWQQESTSGRKVNVTNNNGQFDLVYIDPSKKGIFSSLQEGAEINLISSSPTDFTLSVVYIGATEIFNFRTAEDGKYEYAHTVIRKLPIPKVSASIGACQKINFDLIK